MTKRPVQLLFVESNPRDREAWEQFAVARNLSIESHMATSVAEVNDLGILPDVDVVVADYRFTDGELVASLDLFAGRPLIVTAADGNEQIAARVIQAGACEYLVKDPQGRYLDSLAIAIDRAVQPKAGAEDLVARNDRLESVLLEQSATLEALARERQEIAVALRTSKTNLRSIVESAAGFAVFRLSLVEKSPFRVKVNFISSSIYEIMGIEPENYSPTHYLKNVHPDDKQKILAASREAMETSRFNEVCRVYHPIKEQWKWVQLLAKGVRDDSGIITDINGIFIDVTEKQQAREELKKKALDLQSANLALNALLKNREEATATLEKNIRANMNNLVFPSLERVMQTRLNDNQKNHLEIVHASLKELMSSFSRKMSTKFLSLSPTEIEVANLIKHGKSVKEIAAILNISAITAKNHRQKIREKVGIKNTKVNLRTYLLSLE